MEAKSSGDKNRIAGRDLQEIRIRMSNLAGSQTINITTEPHIYDKYSDTISQLDELNIFLTAIAETDENKFISIWEKVTSKVYESGNVDKKSSKNHTTEFFIKKLLEQYSKKDIHNIFIHRLQRISIENGFNNDLVKFCSIKFGTKKIKKLSLPQLIIASSWLENSIKTSYQMSLKRFRLADYFITYNKAVTLTLIVTLSAFCGILYKNSSKK